MEKVKTAFPANKKTSTKKKIWLWVGVIVLIVLLASGSYAGYLYFKLNNVIGNIGTDAEVLPENSAAQIPKTILMLGSDIRENLETKFKSCNTDVIMVASFHPTNDLAGVVSIPRDTYMNPAGFSSGKANSYYGRLGCNLDADTESQLKKIYSDYLNVPIDYLVVFNFKAFSQSIDALGGIKVDVDMDMRYVDNADGTNIDLKKGLQMLDGKNALDFVRYRKSNRGTGASNDFERNDRQEKVIAATLEKVKSVGGVLSLGGVLDALGGNIRSDIPSSEIRVMMNKYTSLNRSKISFAHLVGDWRSPYVYVKDDDVTKASALLNDLLQGKQANGSAPTSQTP